MIQTVRHIASYISTNVHNPASTLSNLAYLLLGWLLMPVHVVFGWVLIGVGIGSTGFHWRRTDCWHKADIVLIYYMCAVLGGWLWFGNWGIVPGLVLGIVAHWSFNDYSRFSWQIIGGLGLLAFTALWIGAGWAGVWPVLIYIGLALLCGSVPGWLGVGEYTKVYDGLHALWHVFSATAIYEVVRAGAQFAGTLTLF